MKLVVIEGSGKVDSIKKYLGSGYEVFATAGHVRDLPERTLAVDIENNFKPKYDIIKDKKEVIAKLKAKAAKAEEVLLATDPDREGEAISWHIAHILEKNPNEKCRITFNEISKTAVNKALNEPREINQNLVDAQQARRVLDRIVGYKISPYLNKKISGKLSGGRVQSSTLKMVVDRENEIRNFKPEEFWNMFAYLNKKSDKQTFKSTLHSFNGKKIKVINKKQADEIENLVKSASSIVVSNVKEGVSKGHPSAPFITSTMQQEALNKLGMNLKRTSMAAQNLYEGVMMHGEKHALVTYIRTDSYRVSPEAAKMAKDFILDNFGEKYLPESPRIFKNKKNMQDAHEAIRPIDLSITPESVRSMLSQDQFKLYQLIYNRFIASQMADSVFNSLAVEIDNKTSSGTYTFKVNGKTPVFDGFLKIYNFKKAKDEEKSDDEEEVAEDIKLPMLKEGDTLNLAKLEKEQKFTKPPARFNEASLVKAMEDKGIGRPATYQPTVAVLAKRLYIEREEKSLKPTKLGEVVIDVLLQNFDNILDTGFTAEMEDKLDSVEEGGQEWQKIVGEFYEDFAKRLTNAGEDLTKVKFEFEPTDEVCDKCSKPMVVRMGRFGKFLACSGYPDCKNIKSMSKVVAQCPKCGGNISERKSKKGKLFFGCSNYPNCDYISWNIPTGEKCPKCGEFSVYKETKNEKRIFCPNKGCDYVVVKNKEEKEEE